MSSNRRADELSADEAEHLQRMRAHIDEQLRAAGGWLTFERYMDLALYAPGLGYYSAGAVKLGTAGDFTTAPELSRLFGGCVARQCAQVLSAFGQGSILEIGAGTGRLAVDVLKRLDALGRLPERYYILEISADLRDRQRRVLMREIPSLIDQVIWLDTPPAAPFDGLIIANEVLDALPVARFTVQDGGIAEQGVQLCDGSLQLTTRAARHELEAACRGISKSVGLEWPPGFTSEVCLRLADWVAEVTRCLRRGAVLWFDYGLPRSQYYLPERSAGTLMSHFRHTAFDDPLRYPGLQDITAWVDFTAMAEVGDALGFQVAGYTTQTYFLAGNGVDAEMRELADGSAERFARLANEARRLMMPGEMGERFKVLTLTRDFGDELCGFSTRDFLHTL